MKTIQREFPLPAMPRGFHLVTQLIEKEVPEIREIEHGILHVFIMHTSASLTVNENADPTVRTDPMGCPELKRRVRHLIA